MTIKEIVTKYFEYVNSAQWDNYISLFDDNVIMDEQLGGHLEGIEEVNKGIEGLRNSPGFKNYLVDMVVDGDVAMARWHIQADFGPEKQVEARGVNYFVIKDEKIVRFANYHDTKPFDVLFNK